MSPDKIIVEPFRKALRSLDEAIAFTPVDDMVRDATIQRFEYTYELAWKMIRRHLQWKGETGLDLMNRKDTFREAARAGLISDPALWFVFNEARNETSHDYSREKAGRTYELIRSFALEGRYLLDQLEAFHA